MSQKISIWKKLFLFQGEDSINRMQFIIRLFVLTVIFVALIFGLKTFFDAYTGEYKQQIKWIGMIIIAFFSTYVFWIMAAKRFMDIASTDQIGKILGGWLAIFVFLNLSINISLLFVDSAILLGTKEIFGAMILGLYAIAILLLMVLPTNFFKKSQK